MPVKLELVHPVRIETWPIDGRRITRVFVGDREVPAEPMVMEAAARIAIGAALSDDQLRKLAEVGALVPASVPGQVPDRVALRPEVAMDLELRPGAARSPLGPAARPVLPDQSLPIDLFVPPLRLAALQRLARQVQQSWALMTRAANARGHVLDPDAAAEVLTAVAREQLDQDPILRLTLEEVEGETFCLRPVLPLQDERVQYPLETLVFHGDRNRAIAARAPGHRCGVGAPEDLAAVGTLLGLLGRGIHGQEAKALLGEHAPRVVGLTRSLLATGLVGAAPERPALADLPDGCVQHLGHATLLARLGEDVVLIDPWLPPASAADRPRPPSTTDLPRLSAILLTHHHWDHLNLETFLRLDKSVPVYVPAQPDDLALTPRSVTLLESLGFQQVHTLAWGAELPFADGKIVALPFYGEDPTRLGWAGNTYLIAQRDQRALVHVDSGTDALGRSLISSGALAEARARYGEIGTVFATRRQELGAMVEHGWHFLLRPASEWARTAENACNDARFLGQLAAAAGARRLVLYSEGGHDAYPTDTDFLRGAHPRARDRALQHLWDDEDAIRAQVSAAGAELTLSQLYDRFLLDG